MFFIEKVYVIFKSMKKERFLVREVWNIKILLIFAVLLRAWWNW